MEERNSGGKGLAITSLVSGILSIICLPYIIVSIGLAVCSILCGVFARNGGERIFSKSGITLGIVSLAVTLILFLFLRVFDISSLFIIPSWYNKI